MVRQIDSGKSPAKGRATSKLAAAYRMIQNYGVDRWLGKPSTAGFWWLPEFARVVDEASKDAYLASANPSPLYLMNYQSKLSFNHVNEKRITVLPYPDPIGDQINPEAAFIFALALHDEALLKNDEKIATEFVRYADFFCSVQQENGDWQYTFDWPGSPAPWCSALAQGRGASVMVRAWLMTGDHQYKAAATRALSRFDLPVAEGGFLTNHLVTGAPYYEEYPSRPIGVLNGFMASLLGCWEVAHWLGDEKAKMLFDQGVVSLQGMAPHYLTKWWSVYDLNPEVQSPNYNTPRYHKLVLSYFEVLVALSGNELLAAQREEWRNRLGKLNELRAMVMKFFWKLKYGVFK